MPGATSSSPGAAREGAGFQRGELVAKLGTLVSAIMASSCCWLPVLLLAVGVSGAGIASALEAYRPVFMVVTFGFLGMAFYFTYRKRPAPSTTASAPSDCCSPQSDQRPRRLNMMVLNKAMLWAVTVMAVAFLFFPQYLTGLLGAGGDEITAEMTRSVVRIDGMTCKG